jgi:5,10-methylenetetrahydrofolate reductase
MIAALDAAGDDAASVGVELVAPLIEQIRAIPGIAGIHVMAMGHDEVTWDLVTRAGLLPRPVG